MWCSFQPFSSCKPLRMPWKQKRSSTTWILRRSSKYLLSSPHHIASFINSIIISKLHHHGCFDHQQQHLGQFIRPSYVQKQRLYQHLISSTAAKLFSHCLLITIPFGTKHFRSECVFSVDINGLFLTLSKSWLPLPKFRLNCLGSFFSVETYWTAGLTLKNRRNGFSIKPIQNKEIPITICKIRV